MMGIVERFPKNCQIFPMYGPGSPRGKGVQDVGPEVAIPREWRLLPDFMEVGAVATGPF